MNPIWLLLLTGLTFVCAKSDAEQNMIKYYTDLTNFVSEPGIRAPLFNITHYDEGTISRGYWFMDPYNYRKPDGVTEFGAHIFDNRGELVWSGASEFENRLISDFKVVQINGTSELSLVLRASKSSDLDSHGAGLVMDSHYNIQQKLHMPEESSEFNLHEFNIVEDGRTALVITTDPLWDNTSTLWIENSGFQEIDLQTGEVLFDWKALDHINSSTSKAIVVYRNTPQRPWDWIHINSVDKNAHGDYLVSARHTSTIYKISGRDGSIVWQLGGDNSSFIHESDFTFSWQHDARFREENSTHTIISFLDNGASGLSHEETSSTSSALYAALRTDTLPMTATVLSRVKRPDNGQTFFRGNVQELPNKNLFVCWSENGYISEFTPSGELALDARFTSRRLDVYRAYKFNFTGLPVDPPALKAFIIGTTPETLTTVLYVSWNGATEVAEWHFYGNIIRLSSKFAYMGSMKKEGFETTYLSPGNPTQVYAEGIDAYGNSLGRSIVVDTIVLRDWEFSGCQEDGQCRIPGMGTPPPPKTPNTPNTPNTKEQHSEQHDDQSANVSIQRNGQEVRNIVGRIFLFGLILGITTLLVIRRWRRARQADRYNKYEQVWSDEESLEGGE